MGKHDINLGMIRNRICRKVLGDWRTRIIAVLIAFVGESPIAKLRLIGGGVDLERS